MLRFFDANTSYHAMTRTIPGWVIHNLANFGTCHVTLWPWPLTPWPWTCMIVVASCGQSMFQIWTRSVHLWLSYWRLTTDFSCIFRGCSHLSIGDLKMRVAICTKFGGNIARWYAHTKFKNSADILLGFQTTAAQSWALLSDKAKNRTFWPPVKIRGGVGEMTRYFGVVVHMTEVPAYIWWAAAAPFGWAKGE